MDELRRLKRRRLIEQIDKALAINARGMKLLTPRDHRNKAKLKVV